MMESKNEIPGVCNMGWFLSSSLQAAKCGSLIKLAVLHKQTPADGVNDQVHPITAGTQRNALIPKAPTPADQHQPETDKTPQKTKRFHKPSQRLSRMFLL